MLYHVMLHNITPYHIISYNYIRLLYHRLLYYRLSYSISYFCKIFIIYNWYTSYYIYITVFIWNIVFTLTFCRYFENENYKAKKNVLHSMCGVLYKLKRDPSFSKPWRIWQFWNQRIPLNNWHNYRNITIHNHVTCDFISLLSIALYLIYFNPQC